MTATTPQTYERLKEALAKVDAGHVFAPAKEG
jgi:hypothetical protein